MRVKRVLQSAVGVQFTISDIVLILEHRTVSNWPEPLESMVKSSQRLFTENQRSDIVNLESI